MKAIAALLALGSAAAGLAALSGRHEPALQGFADASPILLSCATLVLAFALLRRGGRAVAAIAAAGVAAPLWLMGPDLARAALQPFEVRPGAPAALKIISANVRNGNPRHDAFLAMIYSEEPDVIVAIEVYRAWFGTLQRLSPDYRLVAGCLAPHECDVVILTRLKTLDPLDPDGSHQVDVRLALPAALGGGGLDVVGVHVPRSPAAVMQQALRDIGGRARRLDDQAIVAGDFNATPWSGKLDDLDAIKRLERRTRAFGTWPTPSHPRLAGGALGGPWPVAAIDHLYVGRAWRLASLRRGPDIGSDHYPLIATFTR